MKVSLFIGSLECGGAERMAVDLAERWSALGNDVTILTWGGRERPDFYKPNEAVQIFRLDSGSPGRNLISKIWDNINRCLVLRRAVRDQRPDVLVSFVDKSNIQAIIATLGLKQRVIACERTYPALYSGLGRGWSILRRFSYRWAETVVAQTKVASKWIEDQCQCRVNVIPNHYRGPSREVTYRREKIIVSAGRLGREKGFDLLLRAFAAIRNDVSEWRVVILGEGVLRKELSEMAEGLGIQSMVDMPGRVKNIEDWFGRAGLVVQASRFEGFPNVVLEAMGMGATVVSSDCRAGPGELINDSVNGRLFPVEDWRTLSGIMCELLNDEQTRNSYGQQAKQVRDRFSWSSVGKLWDEVLEGTSG